MLISAAAATATAAPITPAEALGRLSGEGGERLRVSAKAPQLIETLTDGAGQPTIYVFTFSGERGFMLLAADDAVRPLLGYSETNSFGIREMPEQVKSWLDFYMVQVESARELPAYREVQSTRAGSWPAIAPLMKTQWDQTAPYNGLCPLSDGKRCVTGCVATAMAQVMKYWEYPATGKGSLTYKPKTLDQELSIDFSSTTFNWSAMQDTYGRSYSSTAAIAVANLMKACGYSVNMNYTPWESGAKSGDIANAMMKYFGYDSGVASKLRSSYSSIDAWEEMIYNELKNVGPVIYSGQSSEGGHCFVCDGYDGNGYFHINWGWGGLSDGYFLLSDLRPGEIGTGGYYGGFNLFQDVVTGIMPPVGRLTLEKISIDNAADDSGNVKEWGGYTYRIMDFSNILLSVKVKVSGGQVKSPLYVTVYETDPATKKNGNIAHETQFEDDMRAGEGSNTFSTYVHFHNYDPSKLYTINIAYDLKGQRTTIGSVRMAASSGVDDVIASSELALWQEGDFVKAVGENSVTLAIYDLQGVKVCETAGAEASVATNKLQKGVYVAVATDVRGTTRTLKLLLR